MDEDEVIETDPTGRYIRFASELGRGAYKVVYKAIDRDLGIEVAWNQVRVDQGADFEKLWKEITILRQLSHPNVIVCHHAWLDEKKLYAAFITECMTSGTLRQFMKKAKSVKLKVIKNWCVQILEGLKYIHTRDPPIIHRDIKCDNIFINGSSGQVKIGDLGLATNIVNYATATKLSIIGTPEFMAPEYYEENYNEKVDIWAFGMCVLEMATQEYPYVECSNPAQIFKKGVLPQSMDKILDRDVYEFINECLEPVETRKSAAELLEHPFLKNIDDESNNRVVHLKSMDSDNPEVQVQVIDASPELPRRSQSFQIPRSQERKETSSLESPRDQLPVKTQRSGGNTQRFNPHSPPISSSPRDDNVQPPNALYPSKIEPIHVDSNSENENHTGIVITVLTPQHKDDLSILTMELSLIVGNQVTHIEFEYNTNEDTPISVATEMVRELDLLETNIGAISEYIQAKVQEYQQHIKPRSLTKEIHVGNLPDQFSGIKVNPMVRSFSEQPRSTTSPHREEGYFHHSQDMKHTLMESGVTLEEQQDSDDEAISMENIRLDQNNELQNFKLIAETNNASCDAALKAFEDLTLNDIIVDTVERKEEVKTE